MGTSWASDYEATCEGCRTSQNLSNPPGGIVRLRGDWTVNQYRASQAFLGWLVLQPRFHRNCIAELTPTELTHLGGNIQALDAALTSYWRQAFPDDPVERTYVFYCFESPFDTPTPPPYHMHVHVIARPRCIGSELREENNGGSIINAWKIYELKERVPSRYRRPANQPWEAANTLVSYLRSELEWPK